jgi:hypothetical protein
MIKKILIIVISSFLILSCIHLPNTNYDYKPAKEIRYYDKHGKYTGKSYQRGNIIRYYDKKGKYIGSGRSN